MLKQGGAVKVVRFSPFVFFVQKQGNMGRDNEALFLPPTLLTIRARDSLSPIDYFRQASFFFIPFEGIIQQPANGF